jgi:protein gp37
VNRSTIPYLTHTWSPTSGCSPASAGCLNCWAKAYHVRYRGGDFGVKLHPEKLDEPLRLRKPSVIGVCLMGDLAHKDVPAEFIAAVFAVMASCPQHTFLLLTKRAERMRDLHAGLDRMSRAMNFWWALDLFKHPHLINDPDGPWPLPNVYLGVSIEDQATADERIPILLDTPAAHRWISLEPQVGPVSFSEEWMMRLDGIIQGCESGPKRRPFDVQWARTVRAECAAAPVPYYLKQIQIRQCEGGMSCEHDAAGGCRVWDRCRGIVVEKPTLDGRQHLEVPFNAQS